MKKWMKSYLVFTPGFYRYLMFAVLPALLVILQIWLYTSETVTASAFVAILLYLYVEIFLDSCIFGGIAAKGAGQPEYLKSSKKGIQMMKNALTAAAVKPAVMLLVIFAAGTGIGILRTGAGIGWEQLSVCLTMICTAAFLITAGVTATRFVEGKLYGMCISGAAGMIFTAIYFKIEGHQAWLLPVSVLLAVTAVGTNIKIILWRVRESYYDKGNK